MLELNPNYNKANEQTWCYHVEIIDEKGNTIEVINYQVTTDGGEPGWEDLEGYFEERYPEAEEIICNLIDVC